MIADTALLDTLPEREFRAGYAEVVKYGLLGDADVLRLAGGELAGRVRRRRRRASTRIAIAAAAPRPRSCARDERETGDRMLLNLGHTFGHAFEAAAGFSDRLLHGEAIGLGMALAFEFSARRGLLAEADADRAIRHLAAVGLPTQIEDVPGGMPRPRCADGPDRPGQEGEARRSSPSSWCAASAQAFVAPRRRAARGPRLPRREAARADELPRSANLLLAGICCLRPIAFYRCRGDSRW